ncbi:MAG: glycosyltransferase family 4 protein [Verrucomicrobiota bacterium]
MRVLVVNNYNLHYSIYNWKAGLGGRHHLWGASELERRGHAVDYLEFQKHTWLNRFVAPRWGDLDQQLRTCLSSSRYDLVFAAAGSVVMGLGFLRAAGLFRKPILAVIHHVPPVGRHSRFCLKGIDKIVCLSSRVAKHLCSTYPECRGKTAVAEWGWDLDFPLPETCLGRYVFSVGMSLRDYDTFCQALRGIGVPAVIACTAACAPKVPLDENTELHLVEPESNWVSERDLRKYYSECLAVAVPLGQMAQECLAGLSSLLEGMANAKPVLATRTPLLDIDIEKEGCGIWVEPGDVAGWGRALRYVVDNPQAAREMGRRGRRLCELRYNIERFGDQIAHLLEAAVQPGRPNTPFSHGPASS